MVQDVDRDVESVELVNIVVNRKVSEHLLALPEPRTIFILKGVDLKDPCPGYRGVFDGHVINAPNLRVLWEATLLETPTTITGA